MSTIANPPSRPALIPPVHPLCVTDMLIEKVWPEALPDPWEWNDDAALRSVSAFLAIWSAVSRANGLPAGAAVAAKARGPQVAPAAMTAVADNIRARLNNDERIAQPLTR